MIEKLFFYFMLLLVLTVAILNYHRDNGDDYYPNDTHLQRR